MTAASVVSRACVFLPALLQSTGCPLLLVKKKKKKEILFHVSYFSTFIFDVVVLVRVENFIFVLLFYGLFH